MGVLRNLNGEVSLVLTCADPECVLTTLHDANITLYDVKFPQILTLQLQIRRQDFGKVQKIVRRCGGSLQLKEKLGTYWQLCALLHRPVLLIGILIVVLAALLLPTRIYFIRVEGNTSVPAKLILEQAELCGIHFGALSSEVRSEKMKNSLLQALPQLQWAGVNTSGSFAVISVRERENVQQEKTEYGVSSIVAVRDGVITSSTVVRGSGSCVPGQAVKEGQVLISGYTDCGIAIRATQAEGEVFAKTQRDLNVISPLNYSKRGENIRLVKKYSLIIGKKRINLYKDSGILDVSCDKMYSQTYFSLPGGFTLPVALITEIWTYYDSTVQSESENTQAQLSEFAKGYLAEQMVAGKILSSEETVENLGEVICLSGRYACEEMIGRVQKEEIITPNDKYDGTNGKRGAS